MKKSRIVLIDHHAQATETENIFSKENKYDIYTSIKPWSTTTQNK